VYRRQGRYDEAFTLLRQTLNVLEKSSGPEHPRTASALASLGNLFAAQAKYPEAVDYTQRALHIYRKTFGENSPRLYESQSLLARWAIKQGKLEPALAFARQAFESVRSGKDAARQAESHRLVGEVLFRMGRYDDALTMHQAGLDLCDKKRCDPSLPGLLAATADDLRELGRAKEALPLAEQAERLLPVVEHRRRRAETARPVDRRRAADATALQNVDRLVGRFTGCRILIQIGVGDRFLHFEIARRAQRPFLDHHHAQTGGAQPFGADAAAGAGANDDHVGVDSLVAGQRRSIDVTPAAGQTGLDRVEHQK
jgi:tetratricopeptide (TPR) repeat protein